MMIKNSAEYRGFVIGLVVEAHGEAIAADDVVRVTIKFPGGKEAVWEKTTRVAFLTPEYTADAVRDAKEYIDVLKKLMAVEKDPEKIIVRARNAFQTATRQK